MTTRCYKGENILILYSGVTNHDRKLSHSGVTDHDRKLIHIHCGNKPNSVKKKLEDSEHTFYINIEA